MADQDIFVQYALPPDSNVAQALDALACVSLFVTGAAAFIHPSWTAAFLVLTFPAVVALAYLVRRWTVRKVASTVDTAMNETYEVTDERLKIIHSQVDPDLIGAVEALKGQPMNGVDLVVHNLARTVPKKNLLDAMPVLLQALQGAAPTSEPKTEPSATAADPAATSNARI